MDIKIIVFVSVVLALFSGGTVSAEENVSECRTINESGVYVLDQSISGGGTCIRIEASDVVFDGQGNTIEGTNTYDTYGVYVHNSTTTLTNVTVRNVVVTDWWYGIYYQNTKNGSITENTAKSNYWEGIRLESSSNNTITNNTANSNTWHGISLYSSSNNTITDNTANSNEGGWDRGYGIVLESSSNNTIYNNLFNNSANFYFSGMNTNSWNTTKTLSTNIIGGPWIGGNYWAYPNGTGFSETCTDANTNGICDSNYTLTSGNIDYLPLSLNFTNDTTPPTGNITINGGAASMNSTSVTLNLSCLDTNGCSNMTFSNDGTNYTQPEPYNATKKWNLTSGDGTKTVYVKYIDGVGNNMTAPVNDTIVLDPPTR